MESLKDKKNLLVVFASPHEHGTTRILLDSFCAPFLADNAWEITEVSAYAMNAHPCTGCRLCAEKEACRFDDLDWFDGALRNADALAVASPVYHSSFPAPFKAILDRTQRYFEARFSLNIRPPIQKHRRAVLLLTMGSDDSFGVEVTTHQLERAFSVMNTTLIGCAVWGSTDRGEEEKELAAVKAYELALEIMNQA